MAADYILINRAKQHGNRTVRMADLLTELRALIASENECGNHMFDAADYTVLEEQFGLVAGEGANFLYLLNLMRTIFLTDEDVPGANRKAQMDEFCARIGGQ